MHSKLKVCIKLPWSPEEEKLCSIRKGQEKLYRKFEICSFERFKTMDKSQEKGCFRKKEVFLHEKFDFRTLLQYEYLSATYL